MPWSDEGYREMIERLRRDGIDVRRWSWAAPVQIEGRLATGEPFYFRARHASCTLHVAPPGVADDDVDLDRYLVGEVRRPDASSLTADDAEDVFRMLLTRREASMGGPGP